MSEKVAGRAGSYKVSQTGQSVRVVVRMSRKTFNAIEVVNHERGPGTDSCRNSMISVILWEAFERKREAPVESAAASLPHADPITYSMIQAGGSIAETNRILVKTTGRMSESLLESDRTIRELQAEVARLESERHAAPVDHYPIRLRIESIKGKPKERRHGHSRIKAIKP